MSLLKILLDPSVVRGLLWLLAIATPLSGIALAVWAARRPPADLPRNHTPLGRRPLFWVLSASGPLLGLLWLVFNAIENRLGLDSIAGFLIVLGLFCAVGFCLSFFLRFGHRWLRRAPQKPRATPPKSV